VALNNDPSAPRTVEVATAFGANVALHDYSGNGPDLVTSGQGTVRITVSRNANGRGYVCYSRTGIDGHFAVTTRAVTQEFEGAADLDLPPGDSGKTVQAGRVWCERDTSIRAILDLHGLADGAEVALKIVAPDDRPLVTKTFRGAAAAHSALEARTTQVGFHALQIKLEKAPNGARPAYKLAVTYEGSQQLAAHVEADSDSATQPASANRGALDPKELGRWDPKFSLPNVAIHTHLLPNGKVLFWGRRDEPHLSLDEHSCTPQIWDPATGKTAQTPKPTLADGRTTVNLFCSGHTFLPDGRLLVAGGHLFDSKGVNQATIYDYQANTWTALPLMNNGRWYPTAVTLHDGSALVMSGSFAGPNGSTPTNEVQQVWDGHAWRSLVNFHNMPLFPRVHAAPNGQVFMSGPLAQTYMLDTNGPGNWTPLPGPGGLRDSAQRDYAPSVMYDVGKVIYIGGGNDQPTRAPTSAAEIIDLTAANPTWHPTAHMHHPRRQHNATILPDGTVLVTGGTRGGGGKNPGFNDLTPGQPVHEAELWDPATGQWTELPAEEVDRCYHSTAILLPDATVLSAGGGEYRPDGSPAENPPQDSHRDAQIYHPPYLFRGPRPDLTAAPEEVTYGQSFAVGTPHPEEIGSVSWIRLSSVTHSFNMDQRINFLAFRAAAGGLTITAPHDADICPPGHYMLFLLSKAKVPSIAKILRIAAPAGPRRLGAIEASTSRAQAIPAEAQKSTAELDRAIASAATGTRAAIGLTSRCPYGPGACWGGAYEALQKLDGVRAVRPIANAEDSTADVYLYGDTLPNVDRWAEQIARVAGGSYDFRGVEISVKGSVQAQNGGLELTGPLIDKPVTLAALEQVNKVQFDRPTGAAKPANAEELAAYQRLFARYRAAGAGDFPARVTGPLRRKDAGWILHVRCFEAQSQSSPAGGD
jgi:galactose oxidase